MSFKGKDIISIGELSVDEMLHVLKVTDEIKSDFITNQGKKFKNILSDKKLLYAFFEDSTRTRTSHNQAMLQLGGSIDGFAGTAGTSINKGESVYHTIQMYNGYGADIIVVRHRLEGTAQWLADKFDIPVINAGDGTHEHPTQTLLDLFTIKETQGRLDNLTVSLVGDLKYGRTVHSLALALSLFPKNKILLVSPDQMAMPEKFLRYMKDKGTQFQQTSDLQDAVRNSDIVYMTRLQEERLPDELKPLFDKLKTIYRLDKSMLTQVKENLKVLHPLPIPKTVQEIASNVEKTPYAYYFQQAKNGLYTRMALIALTLGAIDSPDFPSPAHVMEPTNFQEVDIQQKKTPDKKIADIAEGLIIDHLPAGSVINVIEIMGYSGLNNVFPGINVPSVRYGKKDFLKIEGPYFNLDNLHDLNKLALIYPTATINLVKEGRIVRKGTVRLPSEISDLIVCPNGSCISRPEHFETNTTKSYVISREPLILECHYCNTEFERDKIIVKDF